MAFPNRSFSSYPFLSSFPSSSSSSFSPSSPSSPFSSSYNIWHEQAPSPHLSRPYTDTRPGARRPPPRSDHPPLPSPPARVPCTSPALLLPANSPLSQTVATHPLPTPPNSSPPRDITPEVADIEPLAPVRVSVVFPVARPTPVSLDEITPNFLLLDREHIELPVVLDNITPNDFNAWCSRYPDLAENDNVRYEYNSAAERMIVKCMPYPIHDSLQIFMCQRITESLVGSKAHGKLRCGSGTTFTGFESEYAYGSQKLPDAYVRVSKDTEFLTVVAEAGWSEDLEQLIEDAKLWVKGSNYRTRVVLLTAFTEIRGELVALLENSGETEAELMASIDRTTTQKTLATKLLALHRLNCLAEPLLGTIHATMHVYRLDGENNLYEDFTATVLPAPPKPSNTDPNVDQPDAEADVQMANGSESVDLIVAEDNPDDRFDSDSDSDSGSDSGSTVSEPDFYLTLQDLFGTFKPPGRMDQSFKIGFNMSEFRKIIAEQVPAMEKCRAVQRAVKVLKEKGVYQPRETFAMQKSRKRKERV